MNRLISGCAIAGGLVLVLGLVVLAWLLAYAFMPGVREIIDAVK